MKHSYRQNKSKNDRKTLLISNIINFKNAYFTDVLKFAYICIFMHIFNVFAHYYT